MPTAFPNEHAVQLERCSSNAEGVLEYGLQPVRWEKGRWQVFGVPAKLAAKECVYIYIHVIYIYVYLYICISIF